MPDVHVGCNGAERERSGDMGATSEPTTARRNSEFTGSLAEIVDDAAEVGPNCVSHP